MKKRRPSPKAKRKAKRRVAPTVKPKAKPEPKRRLRSNASPAIVAALKRFEAEATADATKFNIPEIPDDVRRRWRDRVDAAPPVPASASASASDEKLGSKIAHLTRQQQVALDKLAVDLKRLPGELVAALKPPAKANDKAKRKVLKRPQREMAEAIILRNHQPDTLNNVSTATLLKEIGRTDGSVWQAELKERGLGKESVPVPVWSSVDRWRKALALTSRHE